MIGLSSLEVIDIGLLLELTDIGLSLEEVDDLVVVLEVGVSSDSEGGESSSWEVRSEGLEEG